MRLLPRGKVPTPNMYVKVLSLSPTGSQQSRELSEPQGKGINGRVDWTGLAFVSVHFSQLYCLPRDSKILSLSEMSLDSSTCHSGYRTMATMRLGIYNCEWLSWKLSPGKMATFIPFNFEKIKSGLEKKRLMIYNKCRTWHPKSILGPDYVPALSPCPGGIGCSGGEGSPSNLSTNSEFCAYLRPSWTAPCPYSFPL